MFVLFLLLRLILGLKIAPTIPHAAGVVGEVEALAITCEAVKELVTGIEMDFEAGFALSTGSDAQERHLVIRGMCQEGAEVAGANGGAIQFAVEAVSGLGW
jgi:hypothetical protein